MRNTTAIPGDDQNPTVVWRAFQNDADQGGSIYVPGGMGRYLIDRPIIVDVDGTVFESDGDAEILNTKSGGIFQLGLKLSLIHI